MTDKKKPSIVLEGKLSDLKKKPEKKFDDGGITAISDTVIVEKASNGYILRAIGYDEEEDGIIEMTSVHETREALFSELAKLI